MKRIGLGTRVFIGFVLGIVLGLILGEKAIALKLPGDIFLRLIKMIVVPLIFCSISVGVAGMGDVKRLRRIGLKILLYYAVTTALAGCLGLLVAHLIHPGDGVVLSQGASAYEAAELPTFSQTILELFPDNLFDAMVKANLMQVIVFAIFLGSAIVSLGEAARPVFDVLQSASEIMTKITQIVMELSPIGVLCLMAATIGEYGLKIFGPLGKFILTDYAGLLLVLLILYIPMLLGIARMPLSTFFRHIGKLWVVTASTTSSSGSLPVTMRLTTEEFGVDEDIAGFTLPLGATMNMNGAVVYYSAAVIFVSQIYGAELSLAQQLMIILTTTLVSVGSPGIPGGGIVMTIMLLTNLGLPMEIVGMIAGIYRIIDMGHTTMNVTGDVVSTLCIQRTERREIAS